MSESESGGDLHSVLCTQRTPLILIEKHRVVMMEDITATLLIYRSAVEGGENLGYPSQPRFNSGIGKITNHNHKDLRCLKNVDELNQYGSLADCMANRVPDVQNCYGWPSNYK